MRPNNVFVIANERLFDPTSKKQPNAMRDSIILGYEAGNILDLSSYSCRSSYILNI